MTFVPAASSRLLPRFLLRILAGLRVRILIAVAFFAFASVVQLLLVGYLLSLQGDGPGLPGLPDLASGLTTDRRALIVTGLLSLALLADFAAQLSIARVRRACGPVVFDLIYGAAAAHPEAAELKRRPPVRSSITRSSMGGIRLGLPIRFLVKAILSFSRAVMFLIVAIVVTDIPAVGLVLVFLAITVSVFVIAGLRMWTLPPGVAAARSRARRSTAAAVMALGAERVGPAEDAAAGAPPAAEEAAPDPAEEVVDPREAARADVAKLSATAAKRFSILAQARLGAQAAIAVGVAAVGLAFPASGLGELVSNDPAAAAGTVLVLVITIAAVAQTIRVGLKFARFLPSFLNLARIHEALLHLPTADEVAERLKVLAEERRQAVEQESEDEEDDASA